MDERRRKEAIEYIEKQLECGYIDLGLYDQDELEIVKEAMNTLKTMDKLNEIGCTSFMFTQEERPHDHIWDMYYDEFEDWNEQEEE